MCDAKIEKGHKTCLVKTKSVYEPVGEKDKYYKRPEDPTDEKLYSDKFYELTDHNFYIKDVNGKKVRVGKSNDDDPSETESDTGSYGSRSVRKIFKYSKRELPIPFFKKIY